MCDVYDMLEIKPKVSCVIQLGYILNLNFIIIVVIETGFHYIALAGLELTIVQVGLLTHRAPASTTSAFWTCATMPD